LLLNKIFNLFYIGTVCFISSGCTSKVDLESTISEQSTNQLNNEVVLVTYQKATNGSRLTFTAGTLKPINNCIYLSNEKGDIPIVFPNTFQVKNNFVSNGDMKFQIGKEVKLIGHATSVENASSILKIPSNDCFKEKKMIWIFGQ